MTGLVGSHQLRPLTGPPGGSPVEAFVVRGNDNLLRQTLDAHDADATIHLQSSTLANRPAAGVEGRKWVTTDTNEIWYDTGLAWVALGGGDPFPDGGFGPANANDEEWDGAATFAARGWTVTNDTYASGDVAINGTFTPSRATWTQQQSSGARLWIAERPLTGVDTTGPISLTFDVTGSDRTNHSSAIEIGFLRKSPSFFATTFTILNGNTEAQAYFRQWTSTTVFINATAANFGQVGGPRRYYLHLQRPAAGSIFRCFVSSDAVNWQSFPLATHDATGEYSHLWVRTNHSSYAGGRYQRLANNWIRVNRFSL